MKKQAPIWAAYAALIAVFIAMARWIPSEPTPTFFVAAGTTAALFSLIGGITAWRLHRGREQGGRYGFWPDLFTMLAIQLVLFAFFAMESVFCGVREATIAEAAMGLLTAAAIAGDARLRWLLEAVIRHWKAVLGGGAALIALVVAVSLAIPMMKYHSASGLLNQGKYDEAAAAFDALGDYRDAPEQAQESRYRKGRALNEAGDVEQAWATLTNITDYGAARAYLEGDAALSALSAQYAAYDVGNLVTMGEFEGRPISWRVVSQQGSHRLLLAEDILTALPYNTERRIVYWETCSLRAWLNGDFLNGAFTAAEKDRILETAVVNADNTEYRTDAGNDTVDRVFLLSLSEFETLLEAHGDWKKASDSWWLRSPGCSRIDAVVIYASGGVNGIGTNVDWDRVGVRPALWIDVLK